MIIYDFINSKCCLDIILGKSMAKTFNMEMNIAKAIGILAVVAGHTNWNIFGDFCRTYSWHMAFFFFIAGYFFSMKNFNDDNVIKILILYIKKSICRYLIPFYCYHWFYGGVVVLIYLLTNKLYGALPTLKLLILAPVDSTPFNFNAPNWYLYQLTISLSCFAVLITIFRKIKLETIYTFLIFLFFATLAILLSPNDFELCHGVKQIIIKILISLFYIYMGYLYKIFGESKIKYNIKTLCIILLTQAVLIIIVNNETNVDLKWARLHHNISAIICPLIGIYFVIFLSKLLAPLVLQDSFVDKIGKNTLHIMSNHVFVMFLLDLCILYIDGKTELSAWPKAVLGAYYKMYKYKFIYTFGALVICTYIGEFLHFTGNKIKTKLIEWKENRFLSKAPCGQSCDAPAAP